MQIYVYIYPTNTLTNFTAQLLNSLFLYGDLEKIQYPRALDQEKTDHAFRDVISQSCLFLVSRLPSYYNICFLGYKASNFVKKMYVTDVLKTSKFERFDRESGPRTF